MTIKVLNASTIRNLHSGQVIVDIEAIVKELIENSLDAHATSIDLIFMNNGLEFIQVKDNGDGIEESDRLCVAKRHYTSKISEFQDLEAIQSYGFRGEALNSICVVSDKVVITTKTKMDTIGKQYDADKEGTISNEKPVNAIASSGTIVILHRPFYNLPVRRQLAQKNASTNMKKVQEVLTKFSLAHPNVRFSTTHLKDTAGARKDPNSTWIKPVTATIEKSIAMLFGPALSDMTERFIETDAEDPSLTIDAVFPKKDSDPSVVLKGTEHVFFYCNQRPINYVKSELKDIVTSIRTRYKGAIGLAADNNKKLPFMYIDIQIPPSEYDVNIEPNKTTVLFHQKSRIFNLIQKILNEIYPTESNTFFIKRSSQVNISPADQQESTPPAKERNLSMLDELINNPNARTAMENWQIDNASSVAPDKSVNRSWTANSFSTVKPDNSAKNSRTDSTRSETQQTSNNSKASSIESTSGSRLPYHLKKTPLMTDFLPTVSATIPKKRAIEIDNEDGEYINRYATTPKVKGKEQVHKQSRVLSPEPRNMTLFQPKPIDKNPRTTKPPNIKQLCNTLNQSLIIDCNIEDIKAAYPYRKEILSESYRIRIQDYLAMNDYDQAGQITKLIKTSPGLEKHGLSFYTRGNPSVIDKHRHQICQLGVVKLKPLYINAIVSRLAKEHSIVCKKLFDRPVQIHLNHEDKLCPVLLGLKSKEQLVDDDLHGEKKITYSEVVDNIVVSNGFKIRWRKDLYSGNLVVQFTGIYSLGTGYGTSDFRELLSMMAEAGKGVFVRPNKVMNHLRSIAEEIYSSSKQNSDYSMKDIERGLETLSWNKGDGSWELGRSKPRNEVLACTISSRDI